MVHAHPYKLDILMLLSNVKFMLKSFDLVVYVTNIIDRLQHR